MNRSVESEARALILRKAAQIDAYTLKISLAIDEIHNSGHSMAHDIAEQLGDEGLGWTVDCQQVVLDMLKGKLHCQYAPKV